jgi:hypothetical protein
LLTLASAGRSTARYVDICKSGHPWLATGGAQYRRGIDRQAIDTRHHRKNVGAGRPWLKRHRPDGHPAARQLSQAGHSGGSTAEGAVGDRPALTNR